MKDFRTLVVWQKAHELTLEIYKITRQFPRDEIFGLTSQIRRASSSIGANIAEGCGRGSDADFQRFLQIAFGSLSEVDCHLILARDLAFLPAGAHEDLYAKLVEVRKMLSSLIRKLQSDR
jgi:four helix bundle protein